MFHKADDNLPRHSLPYPLDWETTHSVRASIRFNYKRTFVKKLNCAITTALLAALIPMAAMAGNTIRDQVVASSSTSTYSLTPGSDAYNGWAAWIQQQQSRQDIAQTVRGVGSITVTVASANQGKQANSSASLTPAAAAPNPGGAPPTTLPMTGTPGQIITITNKLPNGGEQVWNYTWESGGGISSGGWVLTSQGSCGEPNCGITITNPD
jgi:hypothetical protein